MSRSTTVRATIWLVLALPTVLQAAAPTPTPAAAPAPPTLQARVKPVLTLEGNRFRDLNANGTLDPYEDWRRPLDARIDDLVGRMTLEEKAGLMLIDTVNAGCFGSLPTRAINAVVAQNMRRFILRNVVGSAGTCAPDDGVRAGSTVTPQQAAEFTNAVQVLAEGSRLGIPAMFKSNARNHVDADARVGINEASGAFSAFPKEGGIAAAALGEGFIKTGRAGQGDMASVREFARVMGAEWRAIGLRGMYGYMADLATEPRWYRVHETFTEDANLATDIVRTLVQGLQGSELSPASDVALTMKHFPGGGPQLGGLDPHYSFGREQVYPAGRFADHLKPFRAAIDAGVSAIMPYYGVPVDLEHDGMRFDPIGMAFSSQMITDLLRTRLGFRGYVNSDTGIVEERAWGLDDKSVPERVATAINAGTDVLSGFSDNAVVTSLIEKGLVSKERVDTAARRLLKELFELGLFENPYVDAAQAGAIVGSIEHRSVALDLQRKSIVLLKNDSDKARASLLPMRSGARVYVMGMAAERFRQAGFAATEAASAATAPRPSAAGHDYAVIRVSVRRKAGLVYRSNDPATGLNPAHLDPVTRAPWGQRDACVAKGAPACTDNTLRFGGALPWEADSLSFTAMTASTSWVLSPSLAEIRSVMNEVGPSRTVLSIDFRQPYVLDAESGVRNAGALLATFGVDDTALVDVLGGAFKPQGRLPFALANSLEAVVNNAPDAPGYAKRDTLFPFAFGLTYK